MLVVSIGATHPWNIAGVGLDMLVAAELGVRNLSVITGVTAQDSGGVAMVHPIAPSDIRAQLDTIPWEHVDAIRVGVLPSAQAVGEVVKAMLNLADAPVVVDPVIGASLGGRFSDDATVAAIRNDLATLPNVILTPNIEEAAVLLGIVQVTRETMIDAARALQARGAQAVLLKGGHLDGPPLDVLASPLGVVSFEDARLPNGMRGTGCTLAMALACALSNHMPIIEAVQRARVFVRGKIANARLFQQLRVPY